MQEGEPPQRIRFLVCCAMALLQRRCLLPRVSVSACSLLIRCLFPFITSVCVPAAWNVPSLQKRLKGDVNASSNFCDPCFRVLNVSGSFFLSYSVLFDWNPELIVAEMRNGGHASLPVHVLGTGNTFHRKLILRRELCCLLCRCASILPAGISRPLRNGVR